MPAIWTTPRTWVDSELADHTLLNAHLRDNLEWLKTPPAVSTSGLSDISTTSTTFVDMADLSATLQVVGSRLLIGYSGAMRADADTRELIMSVYVDFTSLGFALRTQIGTNVRMVSFLWRAAGIASGIRPISIRWQTSAGTMYQDGATLPRFFFVAEWL